MIIKTKFLLVLTVLFFIAMRPLQAQLKMGIVFFDPPLVFSASQGFNIDLAKKICAGMKEQCTLVNASWNQLFSALEEGTIDVLVGAYVTPERAEKYLFSNSYLPSLGRFLTLTTAAYTTIASLKGTKVGIIKEEGNTGVFHQYISIAYPDLFTLVDYNDIGAVLKGLLAKNIAAAVVHDDAVNYWITHGGNKFKTIGPSFKLGDGFAMVTLFSNRDLMNRINEQLKIIKQDGSFKEIYDNYF